METNFKGKVALVTGSSRGIGRAIAIHLAKCGADVVVHYSRQRKEAQSTLSSMAGSGHIALQANLGKPNEILKFFEEAVAKKGHSDILVNNAGIYEEADWWNMEYSDWMDHWNRTIGINLGGTAHLSFLVAKQMISQGGGKIINITSRGAFRGEPHALPYGSSKAGLNSFGQSMAWALAPKNIYVFTLAPGWVQTEMTIDILESERGAAIRAQSPLNRVAKPEEIANAVAMLASNGMEYMTGCIVDMNGASYLRS